MTRSGGGRGHPDGHEDPGQLDAGSGHVTRGRIGRERSRVLLVEVGGTCRVGRQDADLHDVVAAGAAGLQDRRAVGDGLARPLLDRPAGQDACRRFGAGHPGDVDAIPDPTTPAVQGRPRDAVGAGQLSTRAGIVPVGIAHDDVSRFATCTRHRGTCWSPRRSRCSGRRCHSCPPGCRPPRASAPAKAGQRSTGVDTPVTIQPRRRARRRRRPANAAPADAYSDLARHTAPTVDIRDASVEHRRSFSAPRRPDTPRGRRGAG